MVITKEYHIARVVSCILEDEEYAIYATRLLKIRDLENSTWL